MIRRHRQRGFLLNPARFAQGGAVVTWNPSDAGPDIVLTNDDLTADVDSTGLETVRATLARSAGKYYFEILSGAGSGTGVFGGVANSSQSLTTFVGSSGGNSHGYRSNGTRFFNGSSSSGQASFGVGDVLMFAMDLDADLLWFGKNGTWNNSGDPAAGTSPTYSNLTYAPVFPAVSPGITGNPMTGRFAESDFSYTPPTGFEAWAS